MRLLYLAFLVLAALGPAPAFGDDTIPPNDTITSIPAILLDPGETIEFGPDGWKIQYVPEYKLMAIRAENWPTILADEYWAIFYGQIGTISSGELWLMNLPEMAPQTDGRPLCRTPDGRVYQSTEDRCTPWVRRR